MRLVFKLASILTLGAILVLSVYGYTRVRRETMLFEEDMARDHTLLGEVLAGTVENVWIHDGEARALDTVRLVDSIRREVKITWLQIDASSGPKPTHISIDLWGDILSGGNSMRKVTHEGHGFIRSYFPVKVSGIIRGVLEFSESLDRQQSYLAATVWNTVVIIVLIGVCSGLISLAAGRWLVAQPVSLLISQARRVGAGDLSSSLNFQRQDELGSLAGEMNLMTTRLAELNEWLVKETQARLESERQLLHADRLASIGAIASGVAHELGTPLNVVSARAKMIVKANSNLEEVERNTKIIEQQVSRMSSIIRELLDYARIRVVRKSREDLSRIVHSTVRLVAPLASQKQIEISIQDPQQALYANVDATLIQQALTNLLINGIQAMPRPGEIRIGVEKQSLHPGKDESRPIGDFFCLWVKDQGTGIEKNNLNKIFEPFYTTKGIHEGTGLGLPMAQKAILEHGGWIDVESEQEEGSTFFVYLPAGEVTC